MIVKCQRGEAQSILIYDEKRTILLFQPLTKEWKSIFGWEFKVYAEAHIEGTILVFDKFIGDQAW